MFEYLHIAHLTGTAEVMDNGLLTDTLNWNVHPRRSIGQMFFQPYTSTKEFIFCARNTVQPIALVALAIIDPLAGAREYFTVCPSSNLDSRK